MLFFDIHLLAILVGFVAGRKGEIMDCDASLVLVFACRGVDGGLCHLLAIFAWVVGGGAWESNVFAFIRFGFRLLRD